MKKFYTSLFILILFILTIFFPFDSTQAETKQKVAFIGSSSFAIGCDYNYGFIQLLQKNLSAQYDFVCKDITKSGKGYTYFLDKWKNDVKGNGYNVLVIYAGLNGLGSDGGVNAYKKNLSTIFSEAKSEGLKVIVMGAQPFKGYVSKNEEGKIVSEWSETWGNNVIKNNQWTSQQNIDKYINVAAVVDKDNDLAIDNGLTSDHLHLNVQGNQILYSLIAPYFGGAPLSSVASYMNSVQVDIPFFSEVTLILNEPILKIRIPGVDFSGITTTTEADGSVYMEIPFLGEYISAVYKYIVVIAGIVAAIMLIFAGVQWMLPGNVFTKDDKSINQAKDRIQHAVIGLILIVTSYTILYTINPELVQFRNLRVQYIKGISLDGIEYTSNSDFQFLTGGKVLSPSQYDALAVAAAQKLGIEPCIAKTILKIESGGRPNAIGYDENAKSKGLYVPDRRDFLMSGVTMHGKTFTPPFTSKEQYIPKIHNSLDIKNDAKFDANSPPNYGLDFKRFGYGIGLGQIQVFKNSYCSPGVRGRKIGKTCYTIPQLLTPEKNVEAMANLMKYNLDYATNLKFTGDMKIMSAFCQYNGCLSIGSQTTSSQLANHAYVKKAMNIYKSCN